MRIRTLCPSLVLFWLVAGFIGEASAKPRHTSFEDMMKKSPTIAVAELLEDPDQKNHIVTLEIHQALKGALKPGKHKVSFTDFPSLDPKDRKLVVFLDEKLVWRFVAVPLDSQQPVDKAVMEVRGFYDGNAHWVSPGLATLEQLKTYIKDQSLVYRFRGSICFPQMGKADWKASSLSISGSYDAASKKAVVKGLPQFKGFPAQPEVDVHARFSQGGKLNLTYARNLNRQLEIMGNVTGLDGKNGELLVQFAVTHPEVLTENAFKEYLGDDTKGGFLATFKLASVPRKGKTEKQTMSLTLGKWSERDWDGMQLEGWDKEPITFLALSYNSPELQYNRGGAGSMPRVIQQELARDDGILRLAAKTGTGEFIIFDFNLSRPLQPEGPFTWTFQNELRLAFFTTKMKGTVRFFDGKTMSTIGTTVPAFDSYGFNRNDKK